MAKQGEIQLVISAVSAQAKGELDKLTKQYNKLTDEQSKLTEGTEAYAKKAGEIDKVREKMAGLAKQIESGNITTLDRLSKAEKAAERELRGLVEGTEEYIKVSKRLEGVRGEKDKLKAGIADIGKEMEKTSSGFAQFAGGMGESLAGLAPLGAAAAGAFAAEKLLEFGASAVTAFGEAENAAFQMHNALVVLGGETEESFSRLMEQAAMLEQTTFGFSKAQITDSMQMLNVFGLQGDEIEHLIPKILDYATVSKKDLGEATQIVIDGFMGSTDELKKAGLAFEEGAVGTLAMSEALAKFEGSATAALDVGTNKTEIFAEKWHNFQVIVGEFLVNAGLKLVEWFTPVVEGLSGIWAVLVRLYDIFQAVIIPVKEYFGELAKSYPWLNKVKDAIISYFTPLSQLGQALQLLATYWQMLVAGAVAGTKTIRDIWGEFGTYASNLWGNIGDVIGKVFSGDFSNVGAAIDRLKGTLAGAAKDIGSTFVANYNAEMAKFKPIEDAKTSATTTIKDRKINAPEEAKAETADSKKELDQRAKDAENAAKKQADDDKKAADERLKLRDSYLKRLAEAEKQAENTRIANITDSFEREKAILAQKAAENIAQIAVLEQENTNNTAISAEEKAVLAAKYAENRLQVEQKLAADLLQLEVEHQNDLNKTQLEAEEARLQRANEVKKALSEIAIIQAKDENALMQAKIAKIMTLRDIELDNESLKAEQKLLIIAKSEAEIAALQQEWADKEVDRIAAQMDQETDLRKKQVEDEKALNQAKKEAAISITQAGIDALVQLSQIETDKKVAAFEKEKDARIKNLDAQLKQGKISEQAYAKSKEKIEADATAKIAAIKTEQAKKDKAAAIVQALINTAVAVTAGMASPAIPPFPSAIAAGILGALQVGLIAAKPLPTFSKGGIAQGASHQYGGIKMFDSLSGSQVGEMEGGEYYIFSQNASKQNKWLLDKILYSSMHQNGAPIFANGGMINSAPMTVIPRSQSVPGTSIMVDNSQLIIEIRALKEAVQQQQTKLEAYITYSSLENSIEEVNTIRNRAKRN